eukprot:5605710-Pleurochrysis_carterae.AAC.1
MKARSGSRSRLTPSESAQFCFFRACCLARRCLPLSRTQKVPRHVPGGEQHSVGCGKAITDNLKKGDAACSALATLSAVDASAECTQRASSTGPSKFPTVKGTDQSVTGYPPTLLPCLDSCVGTCGTYPRRSPTFASHHPFAGNAPGRTTMV